MFKRVTSLLLAVAVVVIMFSVKAFAGEVTTVKDVRDAKRAGLYFISSPIPGMTYEVKADVAGFSSSYIESYAVPRLSIMSKALHEGEITDGVVVFTFVFTNHGSDCRIGFVEKDANAVVKNLSVIEKGLAVDGIGKAYALYGQKKFDEAKTLAASLKTKEGDDLVLAIRYAQGEKNLVVDCARARLITWERNMVPTKDDILQADLTALGKDAYQSSLKDLLSRIPNMLKNAEVLEYIKSELEK